MIDFENKQYEDNTPVDFETAIRVGGFYFDRARYLKLPPPPACCVFIEEDDLTAEQLEIVATYHQQFKNKEAEVSSA